MLLNLTPYRLRGHATLVSPALLLLFLQPIACSETASEPAVDLARQFPMQASAVTHEGRGFSLFGRHFAANPAPRAGFQDRLDVKLSADQGGVVLFHGQDGFEARVEEMDAHGAAYQVDRAVVYEREGGASFWATSPGGVEEWLHLEPGYASAERPAAVFRVSGAEVRERRGAVEMLGPDGVVRLRVTAPVAWLTGGRKAPVRLTTSSGGEIELFVDARGEAVLVDPIWVQADPMSTLRYNHAGAPLDYQSFMLVTGGSDGVAGALDTAEVYYPDDDDWSDTDPMSVTRTCHTATALGDGTVLVAGGMDLNQTFLYTSESYDHWNSGSRWSYQPDMAYSRINHTATRIDDYHVLVVGGKTSGLGIGLSGESSIMGGGGSSPPTCWDMTSSSSSSGSSSSSSGSGGAGTTAAVEIYDSSGGGSGGSGSWSLMSSMNSPRERHTATLLEGSGLVLVAGGENNGVVESSAENYDPYADGWTVDTSMSTPREDHTATLLEDGTVLVTGGQDDLGAPLDSAELYFPGTSGGGSGGGGTPGTWVPTASMSTARLHHTAALLPDGTVLVAGGTDGNGPLNTAEIYDPIAKTWSPALPMSSAHSEAATATMYTGAVVIAGGYDATPAPTTATDVYYWAFSLGAPCGTPDECESGYCSDGVCCDQDCSAPCFSCLGTYTGSGGEVNMFAIGEGAGIDGHCGEVRSGEDPRDDCVADDPSTCQQNGYCDGNGGCELYPQWDVCVSGYCQDNTAYPEAYCDGYGTCMPPQPEVCDPRLCVEGYPSLEKVVTTGIPWSMQAWCGSDFCYYDSDCGPTAYCDLSGNVCTPKLPDGQPSVTPDICASGFLADGVCCDAACAAPCAACTAMAKGYGVDGACEPVNQGTDPHQACADDGALSCGTNGYCDGLGACELYPNGTLCGSASCQGSLLVQADLCDGNGNCLVTGSLDCAPSLCVNGTCASSCALDADCIGTAYCGGGAACTPKLPVGATATAPNECLSGFVADGVCCNTDCANLCEACTAARKGAGVDGICGPVLAGGDPDSECPNLGAASCDTDGLCDGAGACRLFAAGTLCKAASCNGTTATAASTCDGSGSCVAPIPTDCAPLLCVGGTCPKVCATDTDCATGFCDAGVCALKQPNGTHVTSPLQCLSGFMADGVCCDSACVGTCSACTAAKKGSGVDGACGFIRDGDDWDGECPSAPLSTCGTVGGCDGHGACALYPAGTLCGAPSCQGSMAKLVSLCDGAGTCVAGGSLDCAPQQCVGGVCQTGCTVDSDCVGTAYCSGNLCTPKKPIGPGATNPNECLSGFVADGVCCNTSCTGPCMACVASKTTAVDGTCAPVAMGTDPDHDCADQGASSCGHNGMCDGKGVCQLYAAGTLCNPASCQGALAIQADLCDGSGTCLTSGSQDCGDPLFCAGGICQTGCVADQDCNAVTAYCDATGTCQVKKTLGQGAAVSKECLSDFVADGMCCDVACQAGACDACSVATGAMVDGSCVPLTGTTCDDGDPCTTVDDCLGGVCKGSLPKTCPSQDQCHDDGVCDSSTGECSPIPKPNGTGCDNGNPCSIDACQAGACKSVHKLDGTACTGGICIAGACVLDPVVGTSSSTSVETGGAGGTLPTSTSSSMLVGGGGGGGSGGTYTTATSPLVKLSGAGCLSVSPGGSEPSSAAPAGLLLALLGVWRRLADRRRR